MLLPVLLAACAGGGEQGVAYTEDRGVSNQPFPADYRAQLLAFLKTYLNNPVGVRDAAMAEPAQRTVGGRLRYVSCLRYNARGLDGGYQGTVERAVIYVDARIDHVAANGTEVCSGAAYAPFPDLEKLTH
jgi:hypothetical protein